MFGAGRPEFTGLMAWRGVIPRERLPAGRMPLAGTNWIGPGRHVVHYPLRRGELLNFVGVVERDDWQIESWTAQGTRGECLADFAGWHGDVRRLIEAIDVPFKWALMTRAAMSRWSEGRVTLLGDACHATLPMLAQGAVMAIEDGIVLARCLAKYGADHATAFARYEAARTPPNHQGRRRLGRATPGASTIRDSPTTAAPSDYIASRMERAQDRAALRLALYLRRVGGGYLRTGGSRQAAWPPRLPDKVQRITARATQS